MFNKIPHQNKGKSNMNPQKIGGDVEWQSVPIPLMAPIVLQSYKTIVETRYWILGNNISLKVNIWSVRWIFSLLKDSDNSNENIIQTSISHINPGIHGLCASCFFLQFSGQHKRIKYMMLLFIYFQILSMFELLLLLSYCYNNILR